jgi:hypothetical protein
VTKYSITLLCIDGILAVAEAGTSTARNGCDTKLSKLRSRFLDPN